MPLTDYDKFRLARSGDRAITLFGHTYSRLPDISFNLASRLQDLQTEAEPIKLIRKLFDHIFGRGMFDRWTYDLDELAALEACATEPDPEALGELAEDRGIPLDSEKTESLFQRFFGKGRFARDAEGRFLEPPLETVAKARGLDPVLMAPRLLTEVNRVALSDDDVATIMAWARSGYSADVTEVMGELLGKKAQVEVAEIRRAITSITASGGESSTPTSTENTTSDS